MTLLPGHRAIRLTLLDCGTFSVRGGARIIGIPAWLVDTDRGGRILIDGGFPTRWTPTAPPTAPPACTPCNRPLARK